MTNLGTYDTLIIGGGIAGLVAGAFLARAGRRVKLLERRASLGGRAQTTDVDEHRLNLGPHALYRGLAFERALDELEVPYSSPKVAATGFLLDGDRRYTAPSGPLSLMTTGALDLGGKLALGRFLARLRAHEVQDAESVRRFVERNVGHEGAARIVFALARLVSYVDDPDRFAASALIAQLAAGLEKGVGYPDGGWQTLVDALEDRATALGVEVKIDAPARSLERDGACFVVRTDTEVHRARNVVVAASPAVVAELTQHEAAIRFAASARPVRAASLDVALRALPEPRVRFALGLDEPTYFSVHSAVAKLAPDGHAVLHCARYRGPNDTLDAGAVEAGLERMLDRLQPGWREVVVHRRFLPQLVVANDTASADRGGLAGRCPVELEEGLYVAGDWVGSEGLLADASAASARAVAERIVARDETVRSAA